MCVASEAVLHATPACSQMRAVRHDFVEVRVHGIGLRGHSAPRACDALHYLHEIPHRACPQNRHLTLEPPEPFGCKITSATGIFSLVNNWAQQS